MRDTTFLMNGLIAHRGYHNIKKGIPENSMLAFEKAIKNNLIIELDVHILQDGNVVVFHDDNLKRMTGIDKNIKDMDYSEIEKKRLQGTNQKIPLLKDVLELINGQVPVIIELKYDVKCGVLEKEVINILKNYTGKYAVKSFNPFSIRYFKKKFPEAIRGQLASNFEKERMLKKLFLSRMLFNFLTKPDFISYDIKALPNNKVRKLRKKIKILGWTIRSKEDLEYAKKYCDNFICENIIMENNIRLFLCGGGDGKQVTEAYKRLNEIIERDKPLLYVPLAMNEQESTYDDCLKWLKNELLDFNITDIEMVRTFEELASKNYYNYSAIFIGGGNTFKLLKGIKDSGAYLKLKDFINNNGIIFGGSAGAIIFGKDLDACKLDDSNEVNLEDTTGFDVLNGISILCHYTNRTIEKDKENTEYLLRISNNRELWALPEEDTIFINGKNIEIIGNRPYYIFNNGERKEINP